MGGNWGPAEYPESRWLNDCGCISGQKSVSDKESAWPLGFFARGKSPRLLAGGQLAAELRATVSRWLALFLPAGRKSRDENRAAVVREGRGFGFGIGFGLELDSD